MTLTMFDAINVPSLPSGGGFCYAGYVGGYWPTYNTLVATFPGHSILSIAINSSENAECLDIENGDATPADAAAWFARQKAAGVTRPCLYSSVSEMPQVIADLNAAGVARDGYRLWCAHWGDGAHICGPSSCNQISIDVDGTQWTDTALGRSLDESLLADDFFGAVPVTPPTVTYLTSGEVTQIMGQLPVLQNGASDLTLPHWYVHRIQSILNGVYHYSLTLDGSFGAQTEAAVKGVQAQFKLTQDGIVGAETWSVLYTGSV